MWTESGMLPEAIRIALRPWRQGPESYRIGLGRSREQGSQASARCVPARAEQSIERRRRKLRKKRRRNGIRRAEESYSKAKRHRALLTNCTVPQNPLFPPKRIIKFLSRCPLLANQVLVTSLLSLKSYLSPREPSEGIIRALNHAILASDPHQRFPDVFCTENLLEASNHSPEFLVQTFWISPETSPGLKCAWIACFHVT